MKSSILYLFVALLAVGLSTSCQKEGPVGPEGSIGQTGPVGPQGPIGPEGPAGQTGTPGTNGTNGQNGEDGNANITLTEFSVPLEDFFNGTDHEVWGINGTSYGAPTVPENAMASVFLYIDIDDGFFEWVALPFNRYFNDGETFNHFLFTTSDAGSLYLYIRNSLGNQPYTSMIGNLTYRVFVATADGLAPETDIYDYNQMLAAYEAQER